MDITELLAFAVKNKASDLHLSAGLPPMIRVHGDIRRINLPPMEHEDVHAMVYDIMSDAQRKTYEEMLEADFSFAVPTLARFRVNAYNQSRGAAAAFRTIPSKVLSLEELNAPKVFADSPMARCRPSKAGYRVTSRRVRDNLVSAYLQATRRNGDWGEPISPFLRHDCFGVDKILTFHRIWSANKHVPAQFLFVRYEDLHRDTAGTLARVLPFLGIDADAGAIAAAIEYCRFDNLRQAEVEQRFRGSALVPGRVDDLESYKVRKGKVGNYTEYLSQDDIAYVDAAVAERGCEFTRASLVH